ncbi:MAG: SAM-dependent methyltransferase [Nitrospinales bacterium]|jgi:SAM-dependent methyltransferase
MNENNEIVKPVCVFCGNPLSVPLLRNISANEIICNLSECADCEIGMVHPLPSDQKLSDLYSTGNYRTDGGTRFNFLIEYLIYLGSVVKRRRIEKYSRKGKILDVGCGRGLFMDIMRQGGWEVEGSELNKETASYAEQVYGLKVYPGKITDHSLAPENFDAINVCGVLEHLKEPDEVLTECHKLLKNDGLLVVLVPDIRSFEFKLGKENWFHLDLPFHLFHFSEKGLVQLLQKKGFKVKRIKRFHLEYSPFGWLQTLLNLSKIKFNLFYDLLKSGNLRGEKMGEVKSKDIFATLILLPIYFPLAFIFSILEPILFRRGGIIQIYASKEKN